MAKKNKKIEKETRRLMEGIRSMIKRKGDGYKFKHKSKKKVKEVKRTCPHWTFHGKNNTKPVPATVSDDNNPDYWRCTICQSKFLIRPEKYEQYDEVADRLLEQVNQIQFWAVMMGGDKEDTEMFLKLRSLIPRYKKVARQVVKRVNKKAQWETNKKRSDVLSQFSMYSSFSYKAD